MSHIRYSRRNRRYRKSSAKADGLTSLATGDQETGIVMAFVVFILLYWIAVFIHEVVAPFVIKYWFWLAAIGIPTLIWLYKTKYATWKVQYRVWRERRSLGITKAMVKAVQTDDAVASVDRTEVYLQRITVDNLFTFIKVGISNNTENRDFLKSDKPVKKEVLDMLVFDTRVAAHAYEQQLLRSLRQKGKQLDIELCQVYMKNGFTECFYDGTLTKLPGRG